VFTGLSAGTELTFLKNTNPYLFSSWDAAAGVFRDGEPAVRYPVPFLGYMEVGRVIDSKHPDFQAGELVAGTWGHKSGHSTNSGNDLIVPVPAGMDPILGIFVAQMGPIAANAILYADALAHGRTPVDFGAGVKGRRVLVWGGGTVGLFTALFARAAGAEEVVIAEPSEFRRHVAQRLGFQAESEDAAWQLAKTWGTEGDRGADLVFQTRAHGGSLHLALRALRPQGTVIDLAFYQGGLSDARLGEEFHHNGLGLIAAQIGRVPLGLSETWTRRRLSEQTLALLEQDGAAVRAHMITHVVPFDDAPNFLNHLIADRPEFLQIVFEVPS
jgi:threonine dehydrogenase-like Zn-dependent dehydrogenase